MDTIQLESEYYYSIRLSELFVEDGIKNEDVQAIVLSSVVPDLTATFVRVLCSINGDNFRLLDQSLYPELEVSTINPYEMGTDLMANAIAAHDIWKEDTIIVDFGTALTFTLVRASGQVEGVNILPGLKTAVKSLSAHTAQLQEVRLEYPKNLLGKNTIEAIQNGVLYGYTGVVAYMLSIIRNKYNPHCKTIATGGMSSILTNIEFDLVDRNLTLNGLRWIADNLILKR